MHNKQETGIHVHNKHTLSVTIGSITGNNTTLV